MAAYNKAREHGWQDTTLPKKLRDALDTIETGISDALRKDGSEPMEADLSMGNHKITKVVDPTDPQDAATMKYVDDNTVSVSGDTMTGDLVLGQSLDGKKAEVKGLPSTPTSTDAATSKVYVDTEISDAIREHSYEADEKFLNKQTGDTMHGDLDMSQNHIKNVKAPIADSDAARKADVDAAEKSAKDDAASKYVKKSGDTMSGDLTMDGHRVEGLHDIDIESDGNSATNKNYVDDVANELEGKIAEVNNMILNINDRLLDGEKLESPLYVTDPAGAYSEGDVIPKGTTLASLICDMLCRPINPIIEEQPSATISVKDLSSGTAQIETGTTVTAAWAVSLNPGRYSFKSQTTELVDGVSEYVAVDGTGVEIESVDVYLDGSKISEDGSAATSGEYALPEPLSDTGVKFSVEIAHTQGNVALTNTETVPALEEPIRISEGTVSAEVTLKGYRKMFYGSVAESVVDGSVVREDITSAVIRGLQQGIKPDKSAHSFTAPAGSTKIIIAFPQAYTTNKPKVEMMTLSWEDYSNFFVAVDGGVQVADARGGNNGLVDYIVYTYEFNAIAADTQFRVTLR